MSDLINIRLTKDCPSVQAMDEAAKALGMSRNEMMIKAIKMFIGFDATFYKRLEAYSQKVKVPMHIAIQNTIIKRWAQDNAKKVVWEINKDLLLEFSLCSKGIIGPKELYEMIYQMTFAEEAKERIAELEQEVSQGLELKGSDKVFYETYKSKYGYTPDLKQTTQDESMAYWQEELK